LEWSPLLPWWFSPAVCYLE